MNPTVTTTHEQVSSIVEEANMSDYVAPRIGSSFQATDLPQPSTYSSGSGSSADATVSAANGDQPSLRKHNSNDDFCNHREAELVHSSTYHESHQQQAYLGFCKRITLENDSQFYCEDDELLLQYLQQDAKGNIPLAQFGLINQLTAGESQSHRRFYKFLHRKSLQRLNMLSSQCGSGTAASGINDGNNNSNNDSSTQPFRKKRRNNSKNEKVGWSVLYDRPDVNAYLMGDLRADAGSFTCNRYGYTDLIAFTNAVTSTQTKQQYLNVLNIDSSNSRGHADRSEMKVRWKALKDRAHTLLHCAQTYNHHNSSSSRPSLRELLNLLHTAHSLPLPSENYGESFVSQSVSALNRVLKLVSVARDCLAELQDVIYCSNESNMINTDVIELQDVKRVIRRTNRLPVELEEVRIVKEIVTRAEEWEGRVQKLLVDSNQALDEMIVSTKSNVFRVDFIGKAEELLEEGARDCAMSLYQWRLKSRVQLERKIQRSKAILEKWTDDLTVKMVSSMVRDINRIGLYSPKLHELYHLHTNVEEWVAQVNLTNRSTTSLDVINELLNKGEGFPLHLNDYLVPLRAKVEQAEKWIKHFVLSLRIESSSDCELDLLRNIRNDLHDQSKRTNILSLHVQGKDLPVHTQQWTLLDLEVQADQWSERANDILKSTPSHISLESSTEYSLEDVRQHMMSAANLRSTVFANLHTSSSYKKRQWRLDYEEELGIIVNDADTWLEKLRQYTQQIKRKRICLESLKEFENTATAYIAQEVRYEIYKIVQQCEEWMVENSWMLEDKNCRSQDLTLEKLHMALSVSLLVDLEEFHKLKTITRHLEDWLDRAASVTKCTISEGERISSEEKVDSDELSNLLTEAPDLPICVSEEVHLIRLHVEQVKKWKGIARDQWKVIEAAFRREQRCRARANPDKRNDGFLELSETSGHEHGHNTRRPPSSVSSSNPCTGFSNADIDTAFPLHNFDDDDTDDSSSSLLSENIPKLIQDLLKKAIPINVYTVEEEATEALLEVWAWYTKAVSLINNPKSAISDPSSKELEALIQAGIELCTQENEDEDMSCVGENNDSVPSGLRDLKQSWRGLLLAEGYRLDRVWRLRNEFQLWREKAQAFVDSSEKFNLAILHALERQCSSFPEGIELVQAFKRELRQANDWFKEARDILDNGKKVSLEKMKSLIAYGDKIKVLPNDELKLLKQQQKMSKTWAARVKKILPVDDSDVANQELRRLITEYDISLIEMPDEIAALRKATSCYCICRESFSTGLMVACDECEEWYHGPCIGVSVAQADRCEKYLCVRCLLTKNMKSSADLAINKIRKWTDWGELIKARQVDGQKHQRKVRRERREIEKKTQEIEELQLELAKLQEKRTDESCSIPISTNVQGTSSELEIHTQATSSTKQPSIDTSTHEIASIKVTDISSSEEKISSSVQIAMSETPIIGVNAKIESLREKIERANKAVTGCSERLSKLENLTHERKDREEKENSMSSILREWSLKVFRHIFAPESEEIVINSRPTSNGEFSKVMKDLLDEASSLDILRFPDVQIIKNCFSSMAWIYQTQLIFAKKPLMSEVETILERCEHISLPDERATKVIKNIYVRSKAWQDRVQLALAPSVDTKKPYDVSMLEKLYKELRNLPIIMIEESRLWNTMDDSGARHCLCGGPGDGSFMLACDKCERWFHGACVGLDKRTGESLTTWDCPDCNTDYGEIKPITAEAIIEPVRARSPHAPSIDFLWPPIRKENLPEVKVTTKGSFLQERRASQLNKSEENNQGAKRNAPLSPSSAPMLKQRKRLVLSKVRKSPELSPNDKVLTEEPLLKSISTTTTSTGLNPHLGAPSTIQNPFSISSAYPGHINLGPFLNTGMMAPEATMMLSGTIAALSAQALLANSALFPTNPALTSVTSNFMNSQRSLTSKMPGSEEERTSSNPSSDEKLTPKNVNQSN